MRSSKPFLIDFFVIGAQKCATSWLYYCLDEHPQVIVPDDKVEHAYIGGDLFKNKGEDWYFGRFSETDQQKVVGDVAVDYMIDPAAPCAVSNYTRNPKFVACIRNPVDRMVSAYFWKVRRGYLPNKPIERAFKPLLSQPTGFPNRLDEPHLDSLVTRSFYGEQLAPYVDQYSPDSLLVVLYDDIQCDRKHVVRKVFSHLGVQSTYVPPSLDQKPKVNTKYKTLIDIERMIPGRTGAIIGDYLNRILSFTSSRNNPLPAEMKKELLVKFKPHIRDVEQILDRTPHENRPSTINLWELWS
ncbi:sulfotransferase domain-containing protein [Salinibacter ruber]|uniref:sulfotransferase domain-containing protein n=1 Tax=Salinibacter ruber TaxID=146919 RepID=UPI0013E8F494|nr:sulfotransferase domain-containing protein [Salinibacter ruber]